MINAPFLIFLVGAALSLTVRGNLRKTIMLVTPVVGLINLITLDQSLSWSMQWLDLELVLFQG